MFLWEHALDAIGALLLLTLVILVLLFLYVTLVILVMLPFFVTLLIGDVVLVCDAVDLGAVAIFHDSANW